MAETGAWRKGPKLAPWRDGGQLTTPSRGGDRADELHLPFLRNGLALLRGPISRLR